MENAQELDMQAQHIKVEVLETEDNLLWNKEGKFQLYIKEDIKKEMAELEACISKYECYICGEIFTDKSSLEHHVNEYHQSSCEEESKSSKQTNRNKNTVFKCDHPNCEKSFRNIYTLAKHAIVHSDDRPFVCNHTECEKSFKRKQDLNAHLIVHSDEKLFKCNYEGCKKAYKYRSSFMVHIDECHQNFDKDELHQSVANSEKQDLIRYKCEQCGKHFRNNCKLREHSIAHSDERPFKCTQDGCSKSFKRKRHLNKHRAVHTQGNLYKCSYETCGNAFKSRYFLMKHLRQHNDNAPPLKHTHDRRSKTFKRNKDLTSHHLQDSSSVEMIVCDYPGCSTKFRWKYSYVRHMKRHTGSREHCCRFEDCNATFYRRDHLVHHIKQIHTKQSSCNGDSNYSSCSENSKEVLENNDSSDGHQVKEEPNDKVEHQCSCCEKIFSEEYEFEKHVQCCGQHIKREFVEVDQVHKFYLAQNVKSECEDGD